MMAVTKSDCFFLYRFSFHFFFVYSFSYSVSAIIFYHILSFSCGWETGRWLWAVGFFDVSRFAYGLYEA